MSLFSPSIMRGTKAIIISLHHQMKIRTLLSKLSTSESEMPCISFLKHDNKLVLLFLDIWRLERKLSSPYISNVQWLTGGHIAIYILIQKGVAEGNRGHRSHWSRAILFIEQDKFYKLFYGSPKWHYISFVLFYLLELNHKLTSKRGYSEWK